MSFTPEAAFDGLGPDQEDGYLAAEKYFLGTNQSAALQLAEAPINDWPA